MAGALHPCDGSEHAAWLVVNPWRCVDASASFLLQFLGFQFGLSHSFVIASLITFTAVFTAVDTGITKGFFLHNRERRDGRLAAIQNDIAARDVIGVFLAGSFLDERANAIEVFIGQSVSFFLLL